MIIKKDPKELEKPIKGSSIVFDWGNTLVFDPFDDLKGPVSLEAVNLGRQEYGIDIDQEKLSVEWTKANAEMSFQFASHYSQEEPFIQMGLRNTGVPEEVRALLAPRLLASYRANFRKLLEVDSRKDELRKVLEELKKRGKHLAVLSNDRSFTPKSTLTWLGVADLFDHFLTSEEIGVEKPDPEVFTIASQRFNKPISDIIYVGDDPIRDVQCAHQAGAKAVLYIPPEKYRASRSWRDYTNFPDKPEAQVTEFSQLLDVIA